MSTSHTFVKSALILVAAFSVGGIAQAGGPGNTGVLNTPKPKTISASTLASGPGNTGVLGKHEPLGLGNTGVI